MPLFRVVRGQPTDGELAALVAVVTSRIAEGALGQPSARRNEWSALGRLVRVPLRPGPSGWRASALPR